MRKSFCFQICLLAGILSHQNSALGQSGWSWQNPLPQANDLSNIIFIDRYNGWAVGSYGTRRDH